MSVWINPFLRLIIAAVFIFSIALIFYAAIIVSQEYGWSNAGLKLVIVLLVVAVGEAVCLYVFSPSSGSADEAFITPPFRRAHWGYALTLGTYLVALQVFLAYLAALVWLVPGSSIVSWIGEFNLEITSPRVGLLQNLFLSACAAGLGGSVFMVRELYIYYCFGKDHKNAEGKSSKIDGVDTGMKDAKGNPITVDGLAVKEFLQPEHLPRYVLLPISATVLGPIVLSLMMASKISLGVDEIAVSRPTIVAVCFILGFSYHDTLHFLGKLSEQIFSPK